MFLHGEIVHLNTRLRGTFSYVGGAKYFSLPYLNNDNRVHLVWVDLSPCWLATDAFIAKCKRLRLEEDNQCLFDLVADYEVLLSPTASDAGENVVIDESKPWKA